MSGTTPLRDPTPDALAPRLVLESTGALTFPEALAVSPDGTLLLASYLDHVVVFDLLVERVRAALRVGASVGHDVAVWDGPTRRLRHRVKAHERIEAVRLSADGRTLATLGADNDEDLGEESSGARVFHIAGKRPREVRLDLVASTATALAFSPDGRRIAVGFWAPKLAMIDLASRRTVWERRFEKGGDVRRLALSPDGRRLAVVGEKLRLVNFETGRVLRRLGAGTRSTCYSALFLPRGRLCLANHCDPLTMIEPATGRRRELPVGIPAPVATAIDAARGRIAFRAFEGPIHVFDPGGHRAIKPRRASAAKTAWEGGPKALASELAATESYQRDSTSPDGRYRAEWREAFGYDLVEVATGARHEVRHDGVGAPIFTPDGRLLIAVREERAGPEGVYKEGLEARRVAREAREAARQSAKEEPEVLAPWMDGDEEEDEDAAFRRSEPTPEEDETFEMHERRLRAGRIGDCRIEIWHVATGIRWQSIRGHTDLVRTWATDGRRIASSGLDGTLRVFDIAAGRQLWRRDDEGEMGSLVFDPEGKTLFASSGAGARLFDVESGERRVTFPTASFRAAFLRDGRILAFGADDDIRLYDRASGAALTTMRGHERRIVARALDAGERWLVTGSEDASVRLWDLASGAERLRLYGFLDGSHAAFDADGRWDTTGGTAAEAFMMWFGERAGRLADVPERRVPGLAARVLASVLGTAVEVVRRAP